VSWIPVQRFCRCVLLCCGQYLLLFVIILWTDNTWQKHKLMPKARLLHVNSHCSYYNCTFFIFVRMTFVRKYVYIISYAYGSIRTFGEDATRSDLRHLVIQYGICNPAGAYQNKRLAIISFTKVYKLCSFN